MSRAPVPLPFRFEFQLQSSPSGELGSRTRSDLQPPPTPPGGRTARGALSRVRRPWVTPGTRIQDSVPLGAPIARAHRRGRLGAKVDPHALVEGASPKETSDMQGSHQPKEIQPMPSAQETAELGARENLARVRDILFGDQERTLRKSLDRIEARLGREVQTLRADLDRSLSELEARLGQQLESLGDRTSLDIEDVRRERAAVEAQIEARIDALREEHRTELEELRRALGEAREAQTDRSSLAEMLGEMAERLKSVPERTADGQGSLPGRSASEPVDSTSGELASPTEE